jgi:hypothetical protein
MLQSLSLDPFVTPLVILAIETALVFFSASHLITVRASPREALKHPAYILRTLAFVLLTVASLIGGFILVSPIFFIGQVVLLLVLSVLMFRFWPDLSRTLTEGPISEAVWGGMIALIGLVALVGSVRPVEIEGVLGGVVVGGVGIMMMVGGIRKLSAGE